MIDPNPNPTAQDAAQAVRLLVRWRKPLLRSGLALAGLMLSAAGYYAHHLLALEGWERVAAAQKAHTEEDRRWKEDHDGRLRKMESQDGVLQLVADTLRTVQQELVALRSTVDRLDGYFRALPRYRGVDDERADPQDRARDRRTSRPGDASSGRP